MPMPCCCKGGGGGCTTYFSYVTTQNSLDLTKWAVDSGTWTQTAAGGTGPNGQFSTSSTNAKIHALTTAPSLPFLATMDVEIGPIYRMYFGSGSDYVELNTTSGDAHFNVGGIAGSTITFAGGCGFGGGTVSVSLLITSTYAYLQIPSVIATCDGPYFLIWNGSISGTYFGIGTGATGGQWVASGSPAVEIQSRACCASAFCQFCDFCNGSMPSFLAFTLSTVSLELNNGAGPCTVGPITVVCPTIAEIPENPPVTPNEGMCDWRFNSTASLCTDADGVIWSLQIADISFFDLSGGFATIGSQISFNFGVYADQGLGPNFIGNCAYQIAYTAGAEDCWTSLNGLTLPLIGNTVGAGGAFIASFPATATLSTLN